MGPQGINIACKFIKEAEAVRMLGRGFGESFRTAHRLKTHFYKLSNTIVHLYCHQIETDKQVHEILHYQKVQQAMAIVNALLACNPSHVYFRGRDNTGIPPKSEGVLSADSKIYYSASLGVRNIAHNLWGRLKQPRPWLGTEAFVKTRPYLNF